MEIEEIEILTQKIIKEVEPIPEKCISIYKSILLGDNVDSISYEEYLNQLQKTLKKCTCQASWNQNQLLIHCLDCQKSKNSCICVNCFLKGNHQGHRVFITHASSASCDCGDPLLWSPSGFCPDHPGPESNPEMTQLTKDTRIKLISISRSSLSHYLTYAATNSPLFNEITTFLFNLVSIGDATRRCVCLAIKDTFSFYELYVHAVNLKKPSMKKFIDFLGSLTNDEIFRDFFSLSFLTDLPKFIEFNDDLIYKSPTMQNAAHNLYSFTFHAASIPYVTEMIKKNAFNWLDVFKKSFSSLLEKNLSYLSKEYSAKTLFSSSTLRIFTILKSALLVLDPKSSQITEFVDEMGSILIKNEFCFPLDRVFGDKFDDPMKTQGAIFHIFYTIYQFVNKIASKSVYSEKPLFLIVEFFKSQTFLSNDKLYKPVGDFDRDFHFHSVLDKNVDFSQSFATHIHAMNCLNLSERKSLTEILKGVTDDVEKFLRDWAVIPLRWMATSRLCDFNFFVRNSEDTIDAMDSFNYKKNIKIKFVPTFSLLQHLLKATEDVDGFLLMIISTFGFFNSVRNDENEEPNLDDDQNRHLLLVIYHFVLCLIFDTLCAEKNFFMMRKLAVISKLMNGDLTIEKINSIWYNKVLNDENFCDDLQNFATKVTSKNGSKFHLTNSSEWHPLLPFLSLSSIIPLVQKFINDNPDSLINFPEIPNESARFLFSPIIWALQYYILSHKCCKDCQVIHQLVFNTLIVTSQNSEQFYKGKQLNENESVLHVTDFSDFASQLKNFTFDQFLRVKVVFKKFGDDPKSMIDLICIFGNVGITVLTRINVLNQGENSLVENQQMREEMMKKNRERAKQLKMQIMNNFNKKQKSFQTQSSFIEKVDENDDDEDQENPQKMECVICHLDNEEDCFVYPAFIYKNPLQSYIKWRFRKAQLGCEFVDDFSNIPNSFESFNCVRICLHPIHSKCIHGETFSCPSDRCARNASIPIIAGIFDDKKDLSPFVYSQAENFLKQAYHNDLKFALYSFASQIEILEMRHRSNPGCLDDVVTQTALRNIYLCIWHVMRKIADEVIMMEDFKISKSKKDSSPKYQSRFESLKEKIGLLKDKNALEEDDDDFNDDEFEFYVNENGEKVKRKTIRFSPLMFYISSFLIEKNVKLDTFVSDVSIFDFKEDLSNEYQWIQFLRCAAIFDHFARGCKITQNENDKEIDGNEFIDWDAVLSPSNLCRHYEVQQLFNSKKNQPTKIETNENNNESNDNDTENNDNDKIKISNIETDNNDDDLVANIKNGNVEHNEMTLPMFSFIDLPKNFLDLVHPPYSAPILESEELEVIICLLTGKTVLQKSTSSANKKKYISLSSFLKETFDDSFSVFLKLNGSNASQVIIGDMQLNHIFTLRPLYADKFGDRDIGMKRGSLLYLNEPSIEEIIDELLSGSWTNLFHPK